jgi:hypothetical protein
MHRSPTYRALLLALDESLAQFESHYAAHPSATLRGPLLRRRRAVAQLRGRIPGLRPSGVLPDPSDAPSVDLLIATERALIARYQTVIAEHGADPVIREALAAQKSESEQALLSLLALRRSA